MAVTAVFAADLAQHRLGEVRHADPTERAAASLTQATYRTIPEEVDRTSEVVPGAGLRAAGADAAPAARWRLPEPLDYHLTTFDAAHEPDLASAREPQGGEGTARPPRWRAPRLQF